jgi:hypothetical protein
MEVLRMDAKKFKKIALVGATPDPRKYGNIILKDLKSKGIEVIPVNPKYEQIENLKCLKSVKELPEDIDVIVFVVPPEIGLQIAKDSIESGFKKLWFQPGAESKEIKDFLDSENVEYCFQRCIMVETSL